MSNSEVKATSYKKRNGTDTSQEEETLVLNGKDIKDVEMEVLEGEEERGGWGNQFEFILAIIGYAVGLGNLWRFPYLVQKNGGGTFIIPYIIALFTMGVPIFFLELSVGQRLRKGPVHVWHTICPMLSGVGFSCVVVSFFVCVYYNMIVAWCLYYLAISFQDPPPYSVCPTTLVGNLTVTDPVCEQAGSTQYYWYNVVLESTDSIEDGGGMNWYLVLALFVAWAIIFAITCKGVESVGKAVYFTALFPYVVLVIFFIQGMRLDGMTDGLKHMFTPEFSKLADPEVWLDAASQIFFSLGLGFGGLIAMASYNDVHNNIIRDALLVSSINCGTSIFAGIVIFSFLGYKSKTKFKECVSDYQKMANVTSGDGNCTLQYYLEQVAEGPGLTFIAFTEAISTMPVRPLWSILFFTMLLTLGIGSMIGTLESVRTTLVDLKIFPWRKEIVGLIVCVTCFLLGLIFCQRSGQYWLAIFNSYSASIGLLTIGLLEVIAIAYIYGMKRFSADIEYMLGSSPNLYWKVTWMGVTPVLITGIIIASLISIFGNAPQYPAWNNELIQVDTKAYPAWGAAFAYILIILSVICIPLMAILRKTGLYKLESSDEDANDPVAMNDLLEKAEA